MRGPVSFMARNMARDSTAPFLLAVTSALLACSPSEPAHRGRTEAGSTPVAYVDDRACATCHAQQYEQWRGSHHDLAMQEATDATVLGDFDDERYQHFDTTYRFFRGDGSFHVETDGPDGRPAVFDVAYVFGVEPLQQYLIEFPGGRLQCLSVAWDTAGERWFHLYPDERIAPDDPLHWTDRLLNWNAMCAACHSTRLLTGYDLSTDTYETTWEAIDVGCQACHGPGADHLEWAADPQAGEAPGDRGSGLTVLLRRGEIQPQLDVCAPCHSRRQQLVVDPEPGQAFLDAFLPSTLQEGLYHADGQILDEVYVYGSFAQSRMFLSGVVCTDCHDPHGLELFAPGNEVCTQCHTPFAPVERFSALQAKDYDSPEHHFHDQGSPGARCVSCHMPSRTYMVVDPRRDHGFRVPRPDLTETLGTPNACNDCHTQESASWAAEAIDSWYPSEDEQPEDEQPAHFAVAIAGGRAGDPDAGPGLVEVAGDDRQAPIVRATALELLRRYGPDGLRAMVAASDDEDPLVRQAAVGGLERLPLPDRISVVAPMLEDGVRAVRVEAARALASAPRSALRPDQRTAFDRALAEYERAQQASGDMPWAHLNLATLHEDLGRRDRAEEEYRTALRLIPHFLPARFNLSTLYNRAGRNDEAEQVLREGIQLVPGEGELHYSLGLLLAERGRIEEAADHLARAAHLLPDRARVHYNEALAFQTLGLRDRAEEGLHAALRLAPDDPDVLRALAVFFVQGEEWERALPHAMRLGELRPDDIASHQLIQHIRERLPR